MRPVSDIFSEICEGESSGSPSLCHITPVQRKIITAFYDKNLKDALDEGVPSEKQSLKFAIQDGIWSSEKENQIEDIRKNYNTMLRARPKYAEDEEYLKESDKTLASYEALLQPLYLERERITADSAEKIARDAALMKEIEISFKLSPDEDINEFISLFYDWRITHNDISFLCIEPFFIDLFSIVEKDEFNFFQVAACRMTENQLSLLKTGRYYHDIYKILNGEVSKLKTPEEWQNAALLKINEKKTENHAKTSPNQLMNGLPKVKK